MNIISGSEASSINFLIIVGLVSYLWAFPEMVPTNRNRRVAETGFQQFAVELHWKHKSSDATTVDLVLNMKLLSQTPLPIPVRRRGG